MSEKKRSRQQHVQQQKKGVGILGLPTAIVQNIAEFCYIRDIARCHRVCKQFNQSDFNWSSGTFAIRQVFTHEEKKLIDLPGQIFQNYQYIDNPASPLVEYMNDVRNRCQFMIFRQARNEQYYSFYDLLYPDPATWCNVLFTDLGALRKFEFATNEYAPPFIRASGLHASNVHDENWITALRSWRALRMFILRVPFPTMSAWPQITNTLFRILAAMPDLPFVPHLTHLCVDIQSSNTVTSDYLANLANLCNANHIRLIADRFTSLQNLELYCQWNPETIRESLIKLSELRVLKLRVNKADVADEPRQRRGMSPGDQAVYTARPYRNYDLMSHLFTKLDKLQYLEFATGEADDRCESSVILTKDGDAQSIQWSCQAIVPDIQDLLHYIIVPDQKVDKGLPWTTLNEPTIWKTVNIQVYSRMTDAARGVDLSKLYKRLQDETSSIVKSKVPVIQDLSIDMRWYNCEDKQLTSWPGLVTNLGCQMFSAKSRGFDVIWNTAAAPSTELQQGKPQRLELNGIGDHSMEGLDQSPFVGGVRELASYVNYNHDIEYRPDIFENVTAGQVLLRFCAKSDDLDVLDVSNRKPGDQQQEHWGLILWSDWSEAASGQAHCCWDNKELSQCLHACGSTLHRLNLSLFFVNAEPTLWTTVSILAKTHSLRHLEILLWQPENVTAADLRLLTNMQVIRIYSLIARRAPESKEATFEKDREWHTTCLELCKNNPDLEILHLGLDSMDIHENKHRQFPFHGKKLHTLFFVTDKPELFWESIEHLHLQCPQLNRLLVLRHYRQDEALSKHVSAIRDFQISHEKEVRFSRKDLNMFQTFSREDLNMFQTTDYENIKNTILHAWGMKRFYIGAHDGESPGITMRSIDWINLVDFTNDQTNEAFFNTRIRFLEDRVRLRRISTTSGTVLEKTGLRAHTRGATASLRPVEALSSSLIDPMQQLEQLGQLMLQNDIRRYEHEQATATQLANEINHEAEMIVLNSFLF